jgi:hypothetical protein
MFAWIENIRRNKIVLISTVDTAILWINMNNIIPIAIHMQFHVTRYWPHLSFSKNQLITSALTYHVPISADYKNLKCRIK